MAECGIEITEVRVTLLDDQQHDRLKAFVTMTLNNVFVVRGLKIIQGPNGVFVAMPSRRRPDGQFRDVAHPINNETRRYMEDVILSEYQRQAERDTGRHGADRNEADRREADRHDADRHDADRHETDRHEAGGLEDA